MEMLQASTQHDPLGIGRWTTPVVPGAAWPPRHWLPVQVVASQGRIAIDWAWFGAAPLTAPFFEDSLRQALRRPLNRLFRYRTALDDFIAGAETADSLTPAGLIFHMSRCGSTLTAQMLAALPRTVVIPEAAPIDAVVQIGLGCRRGFREVRQAELLRAMVTAYGRRRAGDERHLVVKLDAWHTLALPLFRRVFPDVPWIFVYRDPVEVLVSQLRQRGMQTVPQLFSPGFYGLAESDSLPPEDYCARVLARICAAACDHPHGGLFVDYSELPQAVESRILPWFALAPDAAALAAMAAVPRRDAKSPGRVFTADRADKQRAASVATRAAAERHFAALTPRLAALNRGSGTFVTDR